MVKAWMAGRKTVTRRLMNPQPVLVERPFQIQGDDSKNWYQGNPDYPNYGPMCSQVFKPRFRPGETVYIKETWAVDKKYDHLSPSQIPIKGRRPVYYKALYDDEYANVAKPENVGRWRSPRFMPEWAARSHARIVSVRPERVQEITEAEAKAEGVTPFRNDPEGDCWTNGKYRTAFEYLWNELHGWCPNSFESNDWVWRIELEKQ
jgi:hypothetical protein